MSHANNLGASGRRRRGRDVRASLRYASRNQQAKQHRLQDFHGERWWTSRHATVKRRRGRQLAWESLRFHWPTRSAGRRAAGRRLWCPPGGSDHAHDLPERDLDGVGVGKFCGAQVSQRQRDPSTKLRAGWGTRAKQKCIDASLRVLRRAKDSLG